MNIQKHFAIAIAAAAACLTAATQPARAESVEELSAQVKVLQQRISQIEADQKAAAATKQAVMVDAEKRSQLVDASQFKAGWDPKIDKFVIGTADGNYTFMPCVLWQFRGIANFRDDPAGSNANDTDSGFENRRARFGMQGSFVTKDLTYAFLWESASSVALLDAVVKYKFTPDFAIRAGQFKDPWTQEEIMSDARQLAVERSALNAMIGGALTDRVQGVGFSYENAKPIRAQIVLHDGGNSKNTSFADSPTTALPSIADKEQYGVTGRVDYFILGTPKQYEDYTAMGNTEDLLVVGAGADYTAGGNNSGLFHAVDVQYENTHGLSLFAEYMGLVRDIGTASTASSAGSAGAVVPVGDYYDYGLLVQAGYMITPKWEVFARYDWTQLDAGAFAPSRSVKQDTVQEYTVGVNRYIYKHNAKITVDLNYLPDGSPDLPGLGYLATESDSFVVRAQFQLAL